MTNRLSAAQRDALERQDAQLLPLALPARPGAPQIMAHVRHVARLLKDRQTASPSLRASSHINALFDRSIPVSEEAKLACRQGCSHCCHQPVLLYAPEAFFLAAHIRARPEMAARVARVAETARDIALDSIKGVECSVLENNACALYAARPLSCHAFVSVDVNACISHFRYFRESRVLSPEVYATMRDICRVIMLAAMKAAGLPLVTYELNTAVAAILAQDNAEKRWLRGEDVLARQERDATLPPQFVAASDAWSAAAAETL